MKVMKMKTEIISAENNILTSEAAQKAAELWHAGEILAFPTETVYGLGGNVFRPESIAAVFAVKNRPADNPLITHLYCFDQLHELAFTNDLCKELFARFNPGPLTLVLKKKSCVPDIVSGGLETAAFRIPSHPVALQLLRAANIPVAAPSANLSGKPSPTTAAHVYEDMQGKIPLIIDGGACRFGVESTVLDISGKKPVLLRPGAVTKEQLEEICGEIELAGALHASRPASPGMKYRHYAPYAQVLIAENADAMRSLYAETCLKGSTMLCLSAENNEMLSEIPSADKLILGAEGDYEAFSRNLFAFFRYADERAADYVIVQAAEERDMGMAFMNRLRKAAARV